MEQYMEYHFQQLTKRQEKKLKKLIKLYWKSLDNKNDYHNDEIGRKEEDEIYQSYINNSFKQERS